MAGAGMDLNALGAMAKAAAHRVEKTTRIEEGAQKKEVTTDFPNPSRSCWRARSCEKKFGASRPFDLFALRHR
jgi:hypothetical protein